MKIFRQTSLPAPRPRRSVCAFTMMEIAISLAIIGIALVAIVGVLPLGMNVQRENREATTINQDASVLLEAIRTGSDSDNLTNYLGAYDDLTNYVYAITNYWTKYDADGNVAGGGGVINDGYSRQGSGITKPISPPANFPLTSGLRIIGLLSTPEYTDLNLAPVDNLLNGGYSNHVVAYVRSISGSAVEKPPQDNDILREGTLSYRMYCVNAPPASYQPLLWKSQAYNEGDYVHYILNNQVTYWLANQDTVSGDEPDQSPKWSRVLYPQTLAANLHELRLTFLWPIQPNGSVGRFRQTYRVAVAGQIERAYEPGLNQPLYFYQPQSFTNAP